MKIYLCPMHPEVKRNEPGKCPKCGMNLVAEDSVEHMTSPHEEDRGLGKLTLKSYIPLIVISGLILLTALALAFRDIQVSRFSVASTISYFMIGFFLTFSGFKLMDLKGFAEGYSTYDLLAQRIYSYGYVYPFIELFFGLAMIFVPQAKWLLWSEFLVMSFSGLGVVIKLLKKERFQCACLGTFLKVPLTKLTFVEDFGMAGLSLWMLMI